MSSGIKEKLEIPDMLRNIYTETEVSPVGLLKNYALNLILNKINKLVLNLFQYMKQKMHSLRKSMVAN